jgi:hypothetical protein
MYRYTTDVEHEMYDLTGNNCRHRNSNKRFKEKCGSHTKKTFDIITKRNICTRNSTHTSNTESTAVCNWKPERGGSPLA